MTDFRLDNRTILITGASSGIGRQTAINLSQAGARVVITGRNKQRLSETLHLMEANDHSMIGADITREDELNNLIKQLPILNGVVFNAGIVEYWPVKFLDSEKIKKIFSINFESQVILTQKLLKDKLIIREASLVYISSISSKIGIPGTSLYASSKAAISSFAKVLASELAGQKMRVNTICPGIVKTPMINTAEEVMSKEALEEGEKPYLLGYGTTTDVANTVVYLLSDAAKWMTGNEIILDGGLTNR